MVDYAKIPWNAEPRNIQPEAQDNALSLEKNQYQLNVVPNSVIT